jgi:hypothetical protein
MVRKSGQMDGQLRLGVQGYSGINTGTQEELPDCREGVTLTGLSRVRADSSDPRDRSI